ncbi:MAG: flagellar assembly protein FliW [Clostridium sp.]|nr:flagellar assembly protein FliW [Clostridium sp.]
MTIQTDYYGAVEYEEADLVVFEDGLFGFHNLTCYLPLCLNEDEDTMILLVSVEKPEVAFVLINPLILCPDYSPNLSPEELSCLGVSDSGELSYYAICVVKRDYLENTVNLKCPLAINPDTRKGLQVILEHSPYGFRHPFRSFSSIAAAVSTEEGRGEYADSQA